MAERALEQVLDMRVEHSGLRISDELEAALVRVLSTPRHAKLAMRYSGLSVVRRCEFLADVMACEAGGDPEAAIKLASRLRDQTTLLSAFPALTWLAESRQRVN